jgi:transposase
MEFSQNELRQLTDEYIKQLPPERVLILCCTALHNLRNAHDRLNRNPSNSSQPPSSRKPWDRSISSSDSIDEDDSNDKNNGSSGKDSAFPDDQDSDGNQDTSDQKKEGKENTNSLKPGKQKGAQGFGRAQKLEVTGIEIHKPKGCKGCGDSWEGCKCEDVLLGAYYVCDIVLPESGKIGMAATYTKHLYYGTICQCEFQTDQIPQSIKKGKEGLIHPGERGLIGPTLLALIVFIKMRMHGTISKNREFLAIWTGILLSDGCISKALSEAGLASKTMEPQIIEALKAAKLLHVDETTWKEHKVTRWTWVAVGEGVVYYAVGPRTKEMAQKILEGFKGWLMTDGALFYREYPNRVRCWGHIDRKAEGLAESCNREAQAFGENVSSAFEMLMHGVYKMRELQGNELEVVRHACEEVKIELNYESVRNIDSKHEDTRKLAVELVNDAQAMFNVIQYPFLPITNNAAEREFRWVVTIRKISHGSKTKWAAEGFAATASIIGTLHARKTKEWMIPLEQSVEPTPKSEGLPPDKFGKELLQSIVQANSKPDQPKFRVDTVKEREGKSWIWLYLANLFSGFRSCQPPPPLPDTS